MEKYNDMLEQAHEVACKESSVDPILSMIEEGDYSQEELMELAIGLSESFTLCYDEGKIPFTLELKQHLENHPLVRILKALLDKGLDPNLRLDTEDANVMHVLYCIEEPYLAGTTLRLMLENGADPNVKNRDGEGVFDHVDGLLAVDLGVCSDIILDSRVQSWFVLRAYVEDDEVTVDDLFFYSNKITKEVFKEFEYLDWKVDNIDIYGENSLCIIDTRIDEIIGYCLYRKQTLPWRWCLVGNIVGAHEFGEEKEIKYGTRYFSSGTKVYIAPNTWGDIEPRDIVIGRKRHSRNLIEIVIRRKYIENFRIQKVYNPRVLRKIAESERTWWGCNEESYRLLDDFIKRQG